MEDLKDIKTRLSESRTKFVVQAAVSVACLLWVAHLFWKIGWGNLVRSFDLVSCQLLVAGSGIVFGVYLSRFVRLMIWIGPDTGSGYGPVYKMSVYLKSAALGSLTPARVGDFSRIHFLSAFTSMGLAQRTGLVVCEKLWDMAYAPLGVMLTAGTVCRVFGFAWIWPLFLGGLALAGLGVAISRFGKRLTLKDHAAGFGLTLAGFAGYIAGNVLFFRAAGIELAVMDIIAITTAMGIMAALPVSLGGLGVREGTLLAFLEIWQVPGDSALVLVILEFFINIIFPVLLFIFFSILSVKRNTPSPS